MQKKQKKEKFYLTTAIVYASRRPHVGNDYEFMFADSIARFQRAVGRDVFFLTGSDEHGQKVEGLAKEAGVAPQAYVDGIVAGVQANDALLNVSYDKFIRTTDAAHMKVVQKIFDKLVAQGDIYKGEYEGWYCTPCEAFWTESQLEGSCCPDCGRPVKKAKEEAYFFRMSKYADRLSQYLEDHPEFIQPAFRKNEMVNNFLKPGLQDLCVTRTSFQWGIPVASDPRHVVYVWIDALTNYITALGYDPDGSSADFEKYWPADVHIIGKDILRFHSIYWPIILMALGLPLPKTIFAHPWLLSGADKMSKSRGNVLYSADLAKDFSVDGVRYFVLSETPYDKDGSITVEAVLNKYNSDLANTLGNLVNRTVAMSRKYFDGKVANKSVNAPVDGEIAEAAVRAAEAVTAAMNVFKTADALEAALNLARRLNKYIDETEPWKLAKDPASSGRLETVLYHLLEGIRFLGVLLSPFLPDTCEEIFRQTGAKERAWDSVSAFGAESGYVTAEAKPLFQRIDEKEYFEKHCPAGEEENSVEEAEKKGTITIEDFEKVQLKVAEVVACEKVQKSNKLLKLTVRLGEEERTVVSGISKHYTAEEMVGKKVVLVANLAPAKLCGVESQGMVLCASDDEDNVILVRPERDIKSGSEVF